MSDNILKIKVAIADRLYPLTVKNEEEEEGIRKAAKKINNLITEFTRNYAVSDKQDALAMVALHFTSLSEVNTIHLEKETKQTKEKLIELNELLVQNLK